MNARTNLEDCLEETQRNVDVDELVAGGMDRQEAIVKVIKG